jgi:6-phosphogluconolactonase
MSSSTLPLFIGGYATAILRAEFDSNFGALSAPREIAAMPSPSFLARSADGRFLYATSEGNQSALHAFAFRPDGTLAALNSVPSEGAWTCHLALSPDGRLLVAASYVGGCIIAYRVSDDGSLAERVAFFRHEYASGANAGRQAEAHAHGVLWTPDGRELLVTDLGGDRVYSYAYDATAGTLAPRADALWADLPAGCGPRHAVLSPDGRRLFVICELDNTVVTLVRDAAGANAAAGGWRVAGAGVSILPAGFAGQSSAAELAMSADGRWLYASNRGHDSIAVFVIDAAGALAPRGHFAVPAIPRHFTLSPDGRWLIVAGQGAGLVQVFALNPESGGLRAVNSPVAAAKASCVLC